MSAMSEWHAEITRTEALYERLRESHRILLREAMTQDEYLAWFEQQAAMLTDQLQGENYEVGPRQR